MVRFAEEKDLAFLKHAWDVCFHDPKAFIDWNFAENFSYTDTLIAESEGVPASNMQLMPHRISLRGREYPINYVSGVATLPEFRNRGLVRELFRFGFPQMEKRGEPISLLVPFNYSFYEKFGYRQCYNKVFRYAEHPPQGSVSPEITPELMENLDCIYRNAMQGKTGYALRTETDWKKILTDLLLISKGKVWFHQTGGVTDGYALMSLDAERKKWEIHEMLGVCDVDFQEEKKPFAMARIVDAKRVVENLAKDFSGHVRLRITDEMIPGNNLILQVENGAVSPCVEYDISLDIKELAPLVFGFCEDVTGTGLFPKMEPYLNLIF